jgi:predicted amidohydrolase
LANRYRASIIVGIAEIDLSGPTKLTYNTAVVLTANRPPQYQRKRGVSWQGQTIGNNSFVPITYQAGVIICSDSYLMDWPRESTLNGARAIFSPANWWGDGGNSQVPLF